MAQPPPAVDDDDVAQPPSAVDDDADDDTGPDDDADDDDTTTTTTTTTVTTTTSTTTTTRPGDACNPEVVEPVVIDRETPFGPWPTFEERGITFRQIISSGAGEGPNDILITSDGLVRVLAQDGRSLDVIAVGPDGEVSREVVDPRGGEWKVLGKDADDHLYAVYTVHTDVYPETWELRAATNKSGVWVRTVLFTSNDDGNLSFDMAVDAAGLVHIIYAGRNDGSQLHYATWDGATYTDVQIAGSLGSWRYADALVLDGAGEPHALINESTGTWHWRRVDGLWTGDLIRSGSRPWDLTSDTNGGLHAALSASGDVLYGRLVDGAWTFENVDDCQDGVSFINLEADAAGAAHISYTDGDQSDVLYATNATGEWVHTFIYEEVDTEDADFGHAWDMASALDADGHIHIVHRRYNDYYYSRDSDLNLSSNETGEWVRRRLIKGSKLLFYPGVLDSEDRMMITFNRDQNQRLVFGLLEEDQWTEETIDLVTVKGLITDAAIAVDSDDAPHILYGKSYGDSYENNELDYAKETERGWVTEVISDTAYYYSNIVFQSSHDGQIMGAYKEWDDIQNQHAVFIEIDNPDFTSELLPGSTKPDDIYINSFGMPTVVHTGYNYNELILIHKQEPGSWIEEISMTTAGRFGVPVTTVRENNVVELICEEWNATPSGFFLATNETGTWTKEFLAAPEDIRSARLIVNPNSDVLVAVTAWDDEHPEGYGVHFVKKEGGIWKGRYIENGIGDVHLFGIHQFSDNDIFVYYDFGREALLTARFEPEMY